MSGLPRTAAATASHSDEAPAPGGAAYYTLAATLGALTAIGPLAIDMYLPALPEISVDLATPAASIQLSLAVYFIGIAAGQAFYGPFSDRLGRKPVLYVGLSLFVVASLGCAFASSVTALVGWRFVQALGGCAPLVIPRAVVRDYFDERGSARMLSVLMLVMGLAPILGPLIGGQLLVHFGWRSVFAVLAAYGSCLLLMVALLLPESLPAPRRRRQAFRTILETYGGLLRDRAFVGHVLTGGLIFSGLLAYIAGSPFVFIELFGVAPERFGVYFGINAVGIITASQVNRWLVQRFEPRRVVSIVLWVSAAAGLALLTNAVTGFGGFGGILVPLFCYITTHGFIMPNTTAMAMAPHGTVAGSASALLGTMQFVFGAAAGIAVSALGTRTAVPLGVVVAACALGAMAAHRVVVPGPTTTTASPR